MGSLSSNDAYGGLDETPLGTADSRLSSMQVATKPLSPDLSVAVSGLRGESLGIVLYGSHARGDAGPDSDVDLLQLVRDSPHSYTFDRVSVVAYTLEQIQEMTAAGSVFAWHLRTEGVIVEDLDGTLQATLSRHPGPASDRTIRRIRVLSAILDLGPLEFEPYADRAIRTARYLTRTALYARALEAGGRSFNLVAAANAAGLPHLAGLLTPRRDPDGTWSTFLAFRAALSELIGPLSQNPFGSLEALAVQSWATDRQLSALAIQTMLPREGEIAYSSLPPPLL